MIGTNIEHPDAKAEILKIKVPPCLTTRPLVFGDREQCAALRDIEKQAEIIENSYISDDDEFLKTYNFNVNYTGSTEISVVASCLEDAEDMAKEEIMYNNYEGLDFDLIKLDLLSPKFR